MGFTLIEILVVISIIGILAGLLYSGAMAVLQRVKVSHSENTALNLRNAIVAYYTDYRRFPVSSGNSTDEYLDFTTNEDFMGPLLGADTPEAIRLNPKRTVFFSARTARRFGSDSFVKGIAFRDESGSGSLWDAWGHCYGVRIDVKNRERLKNPAHFQPNLQGIGAPDWGSGSSGELKYLAESVVVWSAGKENDLASDNVTSW
ncbi:MAG: type II secretion system protein [Verrucomicrobiales bacterium]|nr:type II secretion system protein [Verrucomicrobiales bacterium]